jgi:hypothetical protein
MGQDVLGLSRDNLEILNPNSKYLNSIFEYHVEFHAYLLLDLLR